MKTTSTITCPSCGYSKMEDLPTNMCMHSYICTNCNKELKPINDDCCVFCSYGDTKCPDKQDSIKTDTTEGGFTLIEILIALTIIGILAAVVIGSVNTARSKANITKALASLRNTKSAIALLQDDTGKWPNGCLPNVISNPEVALDTPDAGIKEIPTVGINGPGCEWTAEDIANWNGPYMQTPVDPWGTSYWFDPDYTPYENCASITTEAEIIAIVSFGPNTVGENVYDCDNIHLEMQ